MTKFPLRLILADLRGAGNVGSILRTADACGVELIYACGTTPYPPAVDDPRPAHVAASNHRAIAKTALGAESSVPVLHFTDTISAIREARELGFTISVIEQSEKSLNLYSYRPAAPLALVLGAEIGGATPAVLASADVILELPMLGRKESLNVSVAAAIAMYQLRFGVPSS